MAEENRQALDPTGVALEILKKLGINLTEDDMQPITFVIDDGTEIILDPLEYRRERERTRRNSNARKDHPNHVTGRAPV